MIIRKLTILVVVTNLAASFLITAGVGATYDQRPDPGIDSSVGDSQAAAENISSKRTSLSDSFSGGMIATVGKLTALDDSVFALPVLLENIGIPGWIVDFATGPLYIAMAFDLLGIIRGVFIE